MSSIDSVAQKYRSLHLSAIAQRLEQMLEAQCCLLPEEVFCEMVSHNTDNLLEVVFMS